MVLDIGSPKAAEHHMGSIRHNYFVISLFSHLKESEMQASVCCNTSKEHKGISYSRKQGLCFTWPCEAMRAEGTEQPGIRLETCGGSQTDRIEVTLLK